MPEERAQDSEFKVVDRRTFSVDGTRREDAPAQQEAAEKPRPRATASAPTAADTGREPAEYLDGEGSGFETLVSYLSTTAMFQLGVLPGPGGERIPPDLPNARRTIDMLDVVQEKTQGNLSEVESRLLEDVLYELRLTYVEMEKRGAPTKR